MTAARVTFTGWLFFQTGRQDAVGALARVASSDPLWPEGGSASDARRHLMRLDTRPHVLGVLSKASDEYERSKGRERHAERRKKSRRRAKASRKANRGR